MEADAKGTPPGEPDDFEVFAAGRSYAVHIGESPWRGRIYCSEPQARQAAKDLVANRPGSAAYIIDVASPAAIGPPPPPPLPPPSPATWVVLLSAVEPGYPSFYLSHSGKFTASENEARKFYTRQKAADECKGTRRHPKRDSLIYNSYPFNLADPFNSNS